MEAIVQTLSLNSLRHYERKRHICFGVSPFNSYFTEAKLAQLAEWGRSNFESVHFFIPDEPSVYSLEALGYPKAKAESKARQQSNYTRNKITRALNSLGVPVNQAWEMIIGWDYLTDNERYRSRYEEALRLFESDSVFREECLQASKWVLESKLPEEKITEDCLHHAVKYFLCELPLFVDAAGIFNMDSSVFCYHQSIPFLEKLYQDAFSYKVAPSQGFVVLKDLKSNGILQSPSTTMDEANC